jgi:hypothetical protein
MIKETVLRPNDQGNGSPARHRCPARPASARQRQPPAETPSAFLLEHPLRPDRLVRPHNLYGSTGFGPGWLEEARADILAFTAYRKDLWWQIWSNNLSECLHREIRRPADIVGIFPDRVSIMRHVGAVLAEARRMDRRTPLLGLDILAKGRSTKINNDIPESEAMTPAALYIECNTDHPVTSFITTLWARPT